MRLRNLFVDYHFVPVGQGLFAAGQLYGTLSETPDFCWVYDCGTSSSARLLNKGLTDLQMQCGGRRQLNLVALSHFDRDHISGVTELLGSFRASTLVLPYVPLFQRLLIAFDERIGIGEESFEFFLNPAAFLAARSSFDRIVFVLPSGREASGADRQDDAGPPDGPLFDLAIDEDKPEDESEYRALQIPGSPNKVTFLRPGGSLRIPGIWEFVPYNDQELAPRVTKRFVRAIENIKHDLITGTVAATRNKALAKLKLLYDRTFGRSVKSRNLISLFLYAGPAYPRSTAASLGLHSRVGWLNLVLDDNRAMNGRRYGYPRWHGMSFGGRRGRCSILYSGDGYLNTRKRARLLRAFLGQHRFTSLGVFQVMHHGSSTNWHAGLARNIAPQFSVFSSDPSHRGFKHPHAEVLHDFWTHNPIQVDKHRGATFRGIF